MQLATQHSHNRALRVAVDLHGTRCNWLRSVAKHKKLYDIFCNFAFFQCVASSREPVTCTRNLFCNLLGNGIALQAVKNIASYIFIVFSSYKDDLTYHRKSLVYFLQFTADLTRYTPFNLNKTHILDKFVVDFLKVLVNGFG